MSEAYRTSDTEVPELYAVPRYVAVVNEGPREHFFVEATAEVAERENPGDMPDEVVRISRRSATNEDVPELIGVVEIDDVPENVPDGNTPDGECTK